MGLHYSSVFTFVHEAVHASAPRMMAIALIPVWVCAPASSAAAQSFNDRWSIIPKAHAEPAPEEPNHAKQDTRERIETQNTSERTGVEKRRFSRMFVQAVDLPNECSPETLLTIPIQEEKQRAACRSIGNP